MGQMSTIEYHICMAKKCWNILMRPIKEGGPPTPPGPLGVGPIGKKHHSDYSLGRTDQPQALPLSPGH
jgi:hypothetical protein